MKSMLYVQHKSGQGPVYEVGLDKGTSYVAKKVGDKTNEHYTFPTSEYLPCDPPEEYEDVTERCSIGDCVSMLQEGRGSVLFTHPDGISRIDIFHPVHREDFRVRKVERAHIKQYGRCFIVERKRS